MSEVNAAPAAPVSSPEPKEQSSQSQNETQDSSSPQIPARKKYKYKADGKEIEEELDDNELQGRLAFAKAADRRMKEAADIRKQVEDIFRRLKENPIEILNDERVMGSKKFREIAENYLVEQLKMEQMTPEQKAQMERDKKLAEYEAQEKKRKEDEENQKSKAMEEHWANEYQKTIIDALGKSGLPKNEITVSRMAALMQKSIKAGLDLDSNYLASAVRKSVENELKSLTSSMEAEQLLALFGDELSNKIRKHDLSKFQPKNPQPAPVSQQKDSPIKERLSPREFNERLKAKFNK